MTKLEIKIQDRELEEQAKMREKESKEQEFIQTHSETESNNEIFHTFSNGKKVKFNIQIFDGVMNDLEAAKNDAIRAIKIDSLKVDYWKQNSRSRKTKQKRRN